MITLELIFTKIDSDKLFIVETSIQDYIFSA